MRIFGMGLPELIIILVVILLIFGPKNLPKLGSALGKTVKGLREGLGSSKKDKQSNPTDADVVMASENDDEPAVEKTPDGKTVRRVVKSS